MPTTKVSLPGASGYVLVSAGTGPFLIENISANRVRVVLAASQPAIGADGHKLEMGETMQRYGVGDAYVKSESSALAAVVLVTN